MESQYCPKRFCFLGHDQAIPAGRFFYPPALNKTSIIGYEYGFLGVVKKYFLQLYSDCCRKDFLTTPKKPPPSSPHFTTMTNIKEDDNNSTSSMSSSHNETPNKVTNAGQTNSELFNIANGRLLKALAVLCEGLQDDDDDPLCQSVHFAMEFCKESKRYQAFCQ